MKHLQGLRISFFAGPVDTSVLNPVLGKEFRSASRSIEVISFLLQRFSRLKHIYLLTCRTRREQDVLFGNAIAHGKHRLEDGTRSVFANTSHLACRCHIYTQYRVGFLKTVERELACLDSYIIEVEEVLFGFLYRKPQHHFRSKFDEVYLQYLAHEGERTRSTEVTLNYLNIIIACQELDVKRTRNVQFLRYLTGDALDAAHGLYIQFLRRELNRGIT